MATFRLHALAKQAKPGPPLAPILGQQQIKVQDFINEFNKQSVDYVDGLPLGCRITKLPGIGKFSLIVIPPTFSLMFRSASANKNSIQVTDLYTCLFYRLKKVPSPLQVRTAIGTLKSCRIKVQLQ